ncbi:amino acid-binding ACT domain-containing protein [Hufsiella ginkgonis]|uniref:Amino acid-binding ACT domain-containing protein n=1 Tax=Hufsiella ginkgonis TaxID=2695274 RepID=A0A7K1XWM0_9SPHI|nr:amino acid-binding ACT domain-containing protein [Hufsiella ginkgonis]MXV15360.1 amino acid-binding ACT domain-containing protein [Hufsiella ginkgonis]
MKDIELLLENAPGSLALLGETLGQNGISLEGGGVFYYEQKAIAHFLVNEPERAKSLLEEVQTNVVKINEVIIQKLRQDVPGQLGAFCRRMALAGINILVQYSDHANQLILVVDNLEKGKQVSDEWMKEWWG